MLNALRQNNVDVAILWSLCKETYSYTYFECYAANVFVVTDENSGKPYWILRFVLTAAISYIMVYIGQIVLKKHKKLLRYIGFV